MIDEAVVKLLEKVIEPERQQFEWSCSDIVVGLAGWSDRSCFVFNYNSFTYDNLWTNAVWEAYLEGKLSSGWGSV